MQNYQDFNVTKYLPVNSELIAMYEQRNSKASKTRFINQELKEARETLKDLENALGKNWKGLLHGAWHTQSDLIKLQQHINNIENLKTL